MAHQADLDSATSLRVLYRSTLGEIFGYLMLHTGGDRALAEDLTAETYLNAAQRFREGRGAEVSVAWLKTVAKRRLVDHWRRQTRIRERAVKLHNEVAVTGENSQISEHERQDVYRALSRLDHDHRLALLLRHFDGLSVREVGEQLGRSEKAAESLLARAKQSFQQAYGSGVDHA